MQNEQTPAAGPSLLPCPFCGSNDVRLHQVTTGGGWGVLCRSCHTYQDTRTSQQEKAASAWNRRPHLPSPASSSSVVQGDAGGVERSPGQVAYEGWVQGLPGCEWSNQTATQKRAWEKAAQAVAALRPQPSGETREASSDQPEQGGGMEVVVADKLARAFRSNIFDHPHKQVSEESERTIELFATVAAEALSAEPAEARVRELTERVEYLRKSRDGHAAASHAEFEKRVAAEAQLAKAMEALERIVHMRVELTGTPVDTEAANAWALTLDAAADIASQTLAALQQAGEVG